MNEYCFVGIMDASGMRAFTTMFCQQLNMTSQKNHLQLHHRLFHPPAHIQVQSLIIAMFLFWYLIGWFVVRLNCGRTESVEAAMESGSGRASSIPSVIAHSPAGLAPSAFTTQSRPRRSLRPFGGCQGLYSGRRAPTWVFSRSPSRHDLVFPLTH